MLRASMNVPFLNLSAQHASIKEEVMEVVEKVLAHGHYILGPNVTAFEQEMAAYTGTRFGIGVNSGSDALTLALKALDIGPGDEVITTPFTYIAPAEAIHQCGAKIVFADVDPQTFCLAPEGVEFRMNDKTRAIIPIHLFGQPAPLDELRAVAENKSLLVVEDCAQSIGSAYKGRMTGSIGSLGCYSFYPTKNLGADGDGGMVVTSDEGLAKKMRMLRVHGIERRYFHDLHGFNSRLDEVQAAILRIKLKRLTGWNNRRKSIADRYNAGLEGLPLQVDRRSVV